MKYSSLSGLVKTFLSGFRRLKSLKYSDPELSPENWHKIQPCMKITIASREIILTQPSSTLFVYSLGLLAAGVGLYFLWIQDSEISRLWWGISLLLWGIGALLAGTSYQALGYEIKCRGRQSCTWTSWWEVIYLIFQQVSMNAMLIAVAYSCSTGALRTGLLVYAVASSIGYITLTLIGGLVPIKSLITFEFMVLVSTPIVLIVFLLNGWRYYLLSDSMDLALLGTWIFLILSMAAYWLYDHLKLTQRLWAKGKGIWFSQNDVLHICLILWVFYIATVVADRIKDYTG